MAANTQGSGPCGFDHAPAGSVCQWWAAGFVTFARGLVATGPDSVLILDPAQLHDESRSKAAE
jgi:hypothetical protein